MHFFLDTMFFLHWADIDKIDYLEVFGVSSATLVIPRITTRELDGHKTSHKSKRIRNKAIAGLNLIESLTSENKSLRANVELLLQTAMPQIDFDEHGLSREWNDDVLIASVLQHQIDNPGERVVLISNDTTARIKCREVGIETTSLPEKYQLPEQADEHEDEIRKLKRQIQRLENAMPKLAVYFAGTETGTGRFGLPRPVEPNHDEIAQIVANAKETAREYETSVLSELPSEPKLPSFGTPSTEEIELFKERCTNYSDWMRDFELEKIEFENRYRRAFRFTLEICNFGSAPATDVDVHIHFPDGFELFVEDDLPQSPREPGLPRKPQSEFEKRVGNINIPHHLGQMNFDHLNSQFDTFKLKKTNSYDLTDHFRSIKHGTSSELNELFLIFDTVESTKPFQCEYEITVGNLPDKITGTLNFVIEPETDVGE